MSTGSEHMLGFWWACLVRANPSVLAWHRASSSAPAHLSNLLSPCQPRPPSIPHAPGLGQLLWLGSLPFPLRCHTPTSVYPSKVFSGHAAQLAHPYPPHQDCTWPHHVSFVHAYRRWSHQTLYLSTSTMPNTRDMLGRCLWNKWINKEIKFGH